MGSHRGPWACPQAPLPTTDSYLGPDAVTRVVPRVTPCKRPRYCLFWPVRGGLRPNAVFGQVQANFVHGDVNPSYPHGPGAAMRRWLPTRSSYPRDESTRATETRPTRLFALQTRRGHRCDVGDNCWRVRVASSSTDAGPSLFPEPVLPHTPPTPS